MIPYFSTQEKIAQLQAVAQSWIGTPFIPNGESKGGGVSCQKLVGCILRECGHLPEGFSIDSGTMNHAHAHRDSVMVKFFREHQHLFVAVITPPEPGDVLGIKM